MANCCCCLFKGCDSNELAVMAVEVIICFYREGFNYSQGSFMRKLNQKRNNSWLRIQLDIGHLSAGNSNAHHELCVYFGPIAVVNNSVMTSLLQRIEQ